MSAGDRPPSAPAGGGATPGTSLATPCAQCSNPGPCDVASLEVRVGKPPETTRMGPLQRERQARELKTTAVLRTRPLSANLQRRARARRGLLEDLDHYDLVIEALADYRPRRSTILDLTGEATWQPPTCPNGRLHPIEMRLAQGVGVRPLVQPVPPSRPLGPRPTAAEAALPATARRAGTLGARPAMSGFYRSDDAAEQAYQEAYRDARLERLQLEHDRLADDWAIYHQDVARTRAIEAAESSDTRLPQRARSRVELRDVEALGAWWEQPTHHRTSLDRLVNPLWALARYHLIVFGEVRGDVKRIEVVAESCGVRAGEGGIASNGTLRALFCVYRKASVSIKLTIPTGISLNVAHGLSAAGGRMRGGDSIRAVIAAHQPFPPGQPRNAWSVELKVNGESVPEEAAVNRMIQGVEAVTSALSGALRGLSEQRFAFGLAFRLSTLMLRGTIELGATRNEEDDAVDGRLLAAPAAGELKLGLMLLEVTLALGLAARLSWNDDTYVAAEATLELKVSVPANLTVQLGMQGNAHTAEPKIELTVEPKLEVQIVASLRGREASLQATVKGAWEVKWAIWKASSQEESKFGDFEITQKPASFSLRARAGALELEFCHLQLLPEKKWKLKMSDGSPGGGGA